MHIKLLKLIMLPVLQGKGTGRADAVPPEFGSCPRQR